MVFIYQAQIFSQVTYEAANSGNWNFTTTWMGGIVPPTSNSTNDVIILMQGADKNIFLNGSIIITNSYSYSFMLNSGLLEIYGNVEINSSCNLTTQGSGNIKIYGDLILNNANITCSKPIEVFGNVTITGSGTVNINGGPFIVHGNYTSNADINIFPDAVFAVAGSFEGHLANYNGDGNLYVGSGNYNLLPPVPPEAICTPGYSGPNTSSQCPIGDFIDLANREPAIYATYFGSTTLTLYQLTYTINCNVATITLSGSQVGVNYELYRNGVYYSQTQAGTGNPLNYVVNTNGNYTIKAVSGTLWRYMSGVAVISLGTMPTITSITHGSRCGAGTVTLEAQANPPTATIYWYTQISGGSSVGTGNTFITPYLTSTTYYYVEAQTPPNCVSPRPQVNATIHEVPLANPITHD